MKLCPKCNKEHNKYGIYCSRKCANSRLWSASDKAKKSHAVKKYYLSLSTEERNRIKYNSDKLSYVKNVNQYLFLFKSEFSDLAGGSKRIRVIIEQEEKCNKCGLKEWLGVLITLELEHKDGNRENNSRENLEALCPNCHAQTPTWRGKKSNEGKRQKYLNNMLKLHYKYNTNETT